MDYSETINNLNKRNFCASIYPNEKNAIEYILQIIPANASIGFGGSVTVQQIGLINKLKDRGNILYHRDYNTEFSKEELYQKMHTADWYIASANAITKTGEIINIDGRGNRIGEMVNGPKNILVVAGSNKIVSTIEDGIYRTRNVASPKNCVRLSKRTPCAVTGKCHYCNTEDTICNATVIHHHKMFGQENFYVVIIDKELGY